MPRPLSFVRLDIARFGLEISDRPSNDDLAKWVRALYRSLALQAPEVNDFGAALLQESESFRKHDSERKRRGFQGNPPDSTGFHFDERDSLHRSDQIRADQNKPDQIKKIRREKKVASLPGDPLFLNPDFSIAWEEWEKSRKGKLTDHARALNLAELKRLVGDDVSQAIQIVNQSIRNTWKGFFPLKDENHGKNIGAGQRGTFGTAGGNSSAAASRRAEKSSGEYAEDLRL